MEQWTKKLINGIAGDPEEFPLEHRNLNGACFIAIIGVILACTVDSLVYFNPFYNITVIASGVVYLILYYISRIRKFIHNINVLFLITSIACWSVAWFLSQGIEGTTPYVFFDLLFISLITFKTEKYLKVISFYIFSLLILLFLQFTRISLITPYANKQVQLIDLSLGLIISILIFTYLVTSLKRNYENERAKVERQKVEIEKQNKQIQDKNAELEEKQEEINAQNEKILLQRDQLEKINQDLIEADEMKSRFFANISHEFRTPLTLIMSPLEALLEKTRDKHLENEYSLMLKHSERLLLLINQLLDISKIEKGKMYLTLREININSFIRNIISSFSYYANEKEISIQLIEKENAIQALFDTDKIEKILYNLLSNAFKFTSKKGRIEVLIEKSIDNQNIELIIQDNGIGIPPEKLPYIFDRFFQVDRDQNREYEGTGIGLALTKELVTLHKGTIQVSSTFGKGSIFKVTLPLDAGVYKDENITSEENYTEIENSKKQGYLYYPYEPDSLPQSKPDESKRTILIVEDNTDMRNHLVQNISGHYVVIEANNGNTGIQRAFELQPDLILSDLMMPDMDGLLMTQILKKDPLTCHIPIILLTAKADEESKLDGLRLHADDYITKPFSVKELVARINAQIVNRQLLREKFEKTIKVVPSEITTTSLDEKFLNKALLIIEKNVGNHDFSVDHLCKEMSMSRTNIHIKLKALTNQSTTEFIRSIRLKRAAQLLRQKAGNAGEIADMTGFTNLQYFSRCFKEYFKVPPSDY